MCSAIYRGTNPFSEPETESVSNYLRSLNLAAYITVHSYFQLWMYPYGYQGIPSPDHEELVQLYRCKFDVKYAKRWIIITLKPVHSVIVESCQT